MRLTLLILLCVVIVSCDDVDKKGIQVDLNSFEAIQDEYPYESVIAANDPEYWELNYSLIVGAEVVFSSGTQCADVEDSDQCVSDFEAVSSITGFGDGCPPSYCYYFIKSQKDGNTSVVTNSAAVRLFLGEIDSKADAILLAISEGYVFSTTEKAIGAVKETATGYQLLMIKRVSDCVPVQVNRFLLSVRHDGTIEIRDEEIYSLNKNACI